VVEAKALQLCGKFGSRAKQCAFLHSGWKKHDDALREGSINSDILMSLEEES
jgi:hypothetical protein